MDAPTDPITIDAFLASTLGLLTYLIGANATRKIGFLRSFNIPDPVTGGIFAALVTLALFLLTGREVEFDLRSRDYFLVLFFTAIGLNARVRDLIQGGRPLVILLGLTLIFIALQSLVGMAVADLFGLPAKAGVLLGSVSLIGGHGTAIAWAPEVARITGFDGAMELGIASATIGLVLAALIGGPIAKLLIERNKLSPASGDEDHTIGQSFEDEDQKGISHTDLMRVLFFMHVTIILGYMVNDRIAAAGLMLPMFVPCLLIGIVLGNLLPVLAPGLPRISRTPAINLVSEFSLGIFLAMSLMSMQLWTLGSVGTLLIAAMIAQLSLAFLFILLLIFPLMGRSYMGAVLSAGFGGFALGATPTAIANMTAVTKRYGPAPLAFVVLPLVSAFFVDLANALVIQTLLSL